MRHRSQWDRAAGRVLGAVLALSLLAAPPLGAQPEPSRGVSPAHTLRLGMVQFPADLHPALPRAAIKDYILSAIHRPMTGYASDGSVVCLLCTEVPSLANGRASPIELPGWHGMTVTFTLRDDIFWADGVRVSARDFVLGHEAQKLLSGARLIENVEAIDDRTVRLLLDGVRYDFDRLAPVALPEHIEGAILRSATQPLDYVRRSLYTQRPTEPGLWMGPYRVASSRDNDHVALVPNAHWRGQKPQFAQVGMRLIANTAALEAQLLAGAIDMVPRGNLGLTLDQHLRLRDSQSHRFQFAFQPLVANIEHLAVQVDNEHLSQRAVRQAIMMAIDREAIASRLFANMVEVAHTFRHPSLFGFDPSVRRYAYDPDGARALLGQAGYRPGSDGVLVSAAGARLSIELMTTAGNRARELVQTVLREQLQAVGIETVIRNQPARILFGETLPRRQFKGLALFEATQPLDGVPIHMLHARHIPGDHNNWTGFNFSGYRDQTLDTALSAAITTLEPGERRRAWSRILHHLADHLPRIYLYFPAAGVLSPIGMTGVVTTGRYGPETLWIEEWRTG